MPNYVVSCICIINMDRQWISRNYGEFDFTKRDILDSMEIPIIDTLQNANENTRISAVKALICLFLEVLAYASLTSCH